jgi:hypothetical protein
VSAAPAASSFVATAPRLVLAASAGKGLQMTASYTRRAGVPYLDFTFDNNSGQVLSQFAIKFNVNHLGLAPAAPLKPNTLAQGASTRFSLPLSDSGKAEGALAPVQMAVKTEIGVFVFQDK